MGLKIPSADEHVKCKTCNEEYLALDGACFICTEPEALEDYIDFIKTQIQQNIVSRRSNGQPTLDDLLDELDQRYYTFCQGHIAKWMLEIGEAVTAGQLTDEKAGEMMAGLREHLGVLGLALDLSTQSKEERKKSFMEVCFYGRGPKGHFEKPNPGARARTMGYVKDLFRRS
ncbi:hypothetical protein BDW59DRAFT_166357 [Aspergillus cavernicola]|uniref:Uncharacterized protein n=1 Tax=Aspergillus cavernicola TaxID=176166 RepID=A0ABR4HLS5_9EURO